MKKNLCVLQLMARQRGLDCSLYKFLIRYTYIFEKNGISWMRMRERKREKKKNWTNSITFSCLSDPEKKCRKTNKVEEKWTNERKDLREYVEGRGWNEFVMVTNKGKKNKKKIGERMNRSQSKMKNWFSIRTMLYHLHCPTFSKMCLPR